ncbi:MAG: hypothetical protein EOM37_05575 [Proteobacteria bacterium]|jgi:hypothetical protein|nr:hypothetical protein [Alphaproteobacteria bacterium]NCC03503.1 hypothetical protein [Pseudomonadota bacterium]
MQPYARQIKKWGVALCATLLLAPTAYAKEKKAAAPKDPNQSFIKQSVKDYQTCLEINLASQKGYVSPEIKTLILTECGEKAGIAYVLRTSTNFLTCVNDTLPVADIAQSGDEKLSVIIKDGSQYTFSLSSSEDVKEKEELSTKDKKIEKGIEECAKQNGMNIFGFEKVISEPERDNSALNGKEIKRSSELNI